MKTLTITIIGIACISILIEVLLPEGKTSKYIKGIYSVLTTLIIVTNLVSLYKTDINIEKIFEGGIIENVDSDNLNIINSSYQFKIMSLQNEISSNGQDIQLQIKYELTKPYNITKIKVICDEELCVENKSLIAYRMGVKEEVIEYERKKEY